MLANKTCPTAATGPTTASVSLTTATQPPHSIPSSINASTTGTNSTMITSLPNPSTNDTPVDTTTVAATTTTTATGAVSASTNNDDNSKTDNIGPVPRRPKARPTPFSRPILLSADRRNRKKKSITWQSEEKLQRVYYFEFIADERVNVSRDLLQQSSVAVDNSASVGQVGASPNAHANRFNPTSGVGPTAQTGQDSSGRRNNPHQIPPEGLKHREWKLILIDYKNDLPGPGWNSVERSAQAERETYVLGAIDLPGQPSTLDEPDGNDSSSASASSGTRNDLGVKIIPLDNPYGMYTVYPDLSSSEIVNGVMRLPANSIASPFAPNWTWPMNLST